MEQKILSKQDLVAVAVGFGLVIAVFVFFLVKGERKDTDKKDGPAIVSDDSSQKTPLPMLGVADLRSLLVTGSATMRVADLRSEADFRIEHVTGSILVTSPEGLSGVGVPENGTLVVIPSGSDDTDRTASEMLAKTGRRYTFLKDGLSGWKVAGGTVVTEPSLSSPIDRSKVTLIKADTWKAIFAKKEIPHRILDIRPIDESSKAAIPGALNIPYSELESRRNEIPPASNLALCAGNGDDAFRGAVRLFDLGFFSVKALDGGCSDIAAK